MERRQANESEQKKIYENYLVFLSVDVMHQKSYCWSTYKRNAFKAIHSSQALGAESEIILPHCWWKGQLAGVFEYTWNTLVHAFCKWSCKQRMKHQEMSVILNNSTIQCSRRVEQQHYLFVCNDAFHSFMGFIAIL